MKLYYISNARIKFVLIFFFNFILMKAINIFLITSCLLLGLMVQGQISGTVFRDFNGNGSRQTGASFNEEGVAGVIVKAYNSTGAEIGSTTSSNNGSYSFSGLSFPVRLEFIPTLVDDYSSPFGSSNKSNVQFYDVGTTDANFGINYPEHYCHTASPNIVTTCFVNGRPSTGTPQTDVLVQHPFFASGNMTSNTYLGDAGELGSIWGIAYNRDNGDIYTSSLVKRHTGMKDNDANGTEDIGAIYIKSPSGTPTLWLNMASLSGVDLGLSIMPSIATRNLPNSNMGPSYDGEIFPLIGKIGLGDIEISDDNTKLYVISLFDKKLYTIDIATKMLVGPGLTIPNPCGASGESRPFSVTFHRGKVYVGVICDAINSQLESDLKANVYRLDGGTFTNILSFPLNYVKGAAFEDYDTGTGLHGTKWNPWEDNFDNQKAFMTNGQWAMIHPQPILANIEFDHDEAMILVFNDRNGHQMGTANYGISAAQHGTTLHTSVAAGDMLRAALIGGNYVLENNATSGSITTSGAGNNQGPATINGSMDGYTGVGGEYYYGDQALIFGSNVYHKDAVMGGSTILAGSNYTYVHMVDAYEAWGGGSYLMNNTTGNFDNVYGIYPRTVTEVLFGKANGLGDPEVMCNVAPIEIGNRIWEDSDGDGIQDAGESTISGVTVQLVKAGIVIETATTDADGNYYFSNASGINTPSSRYGITQLIPNMQYIVRIPNVIGGSKQSVLGANALTIPNAGGGTPGTQADVRDSDGLLVGNDAEVSVLTTDIAVAGANNHNFDFGFGQVLTCSVSIDASPSTCNPSNNQYSVSGTINFSNAPASGVLTVSVGSVNQSFNPPFASPLTYTLNGLTSDGVSHTVNAVFSADTLCKSSAIYAAPPLCYQADCSCSEYIYLNEPGANTIMKFKVNPDGSLTEILNNGNHWSVGITYNPHGLGSDLNGFLYIGNQVSADGVDKYRCDGTLVEKNFLPKAPGNGTGGSAGYATNIYSIGNTLYMNDWYESGYTGTKIFAYDICTKQLLGEYTVCGNTGYCWDFIVDEATNKIIIHSPGSIAIGDLDYHLNGPCIPTTINQGAQYGGIVMTPDGHFFTRNLQTSTLYKYDMNGNLICSADLSLPGVGGNNGIGLVYSQTTGYLYLSSNDEDCISIYDPADCSYVGQAVANNGGADSKAIAIIKECCPNVSNLTFNQVLCSQGNG